MTYPKAIIISAVLIAAAIAFAAYQPAQGALGSGGRYMLGPIAGNSGVFVIDSPPLLSKGTTEKRSRHSLRSEKASFQSSSGLG